MNIGFFISHFLERGTEVATFDYARYNEEILGNKSYIICFLNVFESITRDNNDVFEKFKSRFRIIIIKTIESMREVIKEFDLSYFYALVHGLPQNSLQYSNKTIWGKCKTIKHCVFDTRYPEGDIHCCISSFLNKKLGTNIPVLPHIIDILPETNENLRNELNIPEDAVVFGRYGGKEQFDIQIAHNAIKLYLDLNQKSYFLFMNTNHFYDHPRIIYLNKNVDLKFKSKFINTCDAMIHARSDGETFGLSVGEFSSKNKPIITTVSGDVEHLIILNDKSLLYINEETLIYIFDNIKKIKDLPQKEEWWNAYKDYEPKNVMNLFNELIITSNIKNVPNSILNKKIDFGMIYNEKSVKLSLILE